MELDAQSEKFYKQAKIAFQRLDMQEGEVIAITVPSDMASIQVEGMKLILQELVHEFDCKVVVLSQGAELIVLKEEDMNMLGWYRKDTTDSDSHTKH